MLPETASSIGDRPAARAAYRGTGDTTTGIQQDLRKMVMGVFMIEREHFSFDENDYQRISRHHLLVDPNSQLTAMFEGKLVIDSEAAYDQLDQGFATLDHIPVFREEDGTHIIYAVSGRVKPRPRPPTLNILLFLITIVSVLWVGTDIAINEIGANSPALAQQLADNFLVNLWRGIPYAVCILLILGAHEMGHYFAARRHKLAVTLPYFIPAPPFLLPPQIATFGTFGAFIQLREPMKNRKMLLDVGAAGPFVGLVFAIPILFIGLHTSQLLPLTPGAQVAMEGNSLLYALAKTLTFGHFVPNGVHDVFLNQVAWAGWTGLLITALNLVPLGQLDGGHILYSLIGKRARLLYYPLMGLIVLLIFAVSQEWIFWFVLLLLFGRIHAVPLDDITPLDTRRKFWAVLGLIVFVVTFIPVPLSVVTIPNLGTRENALLLPLTVGMLTLWTSRRVLLRRLRIR